MKLRAFIPTRFENVRAEPDGRKVRLWVGTQRVILDPADAITLADQLVDAAERLAPAEGSA